MPRFNCQGEQHTPSTPKSTLIFKKILGLHTLLNHVSLLNFVKPPRYVQSRVQLSKYLQARIKQDCQYLFLSKQESSKIVNLFLHTKQESSKTTIANEGSIKIETRILIPKSSRSRISSKSCSSLECVHLSAFI